MTLCAARTLVLALATAVAVLAEGPAGAAGLLEGGARRLGTKITLEVDEDGLRYGFVAQVIALASGVQYEWYTSSPIPADGVREIGAAALAAGRVHCECHRDREWGDAGEATALWVSRAVLEDLHAEGAAAFSFNEDGGQVTEARLTFARADTFALQIDGEASRVPAVVARTSAGTILWIHDDPADPLVLAVDGAWHSAVTSIRQRSDDEIGDSVVVDGLRLHYVAIGEGTPLIVLHGGPGMEHIYFRPYLDPLAGQFRVIYVDQPGQGLSERLPPSRSYTMEGAVAAVEALRTALGYPRVALLGHSYGGFVAQLYALTHPDRLSALILVDTAPSWEWNVEASENIDRFGTELQRNLRPGLSDDERIRIRFPLYFDPPDPVAANAMMDRLILSAQAWRQLISTRAVRSFDLRPALPTLAVPALVMVGEHDLITTPNQARALATGIPGAELHVFPDTGHNPFYEEPEAFNALVAAFLRRHAP